MRERFPKLIPLVKWNRHYEWPTVSGLRYLIFHANENGFNKAIKKVNGRILIDEEAFYEWVNDHNEFNNNNNS